MSQTSITKLATYFIKQEIEDESTTTYRLVIRPLSVLALQALGENLVEVGVCIFEIVKNGLKGGEVGEGLITKAIEYFVKRGGELPDVFVNVIDSLILSIKEGDKLLEPAERKDFLTTTDLFQLTDIVKLSWDVSDKKRLTDFFEKERAKAQTNPQEITPENPSPSEKLSTDLSQHG